MSTPSRSAIASVPGILALLAWAIYVLANAPQLPDVFLSVLVAGAFGILACLAVIVNFRHWRWAVLLASAVYVVIYLVRVGRMVLIGADSGQSSLLSSLSFYYAMLWQVTAGVFEDKGALGGLAQIFLEYVMPVLIVLLIIATLLSWRSKRA
jgi:hypothetical protein